MCRRNHSCAKEQLLSFNEEESSKNSISCHSKLKKCFNHTGTKREHHYYSWAIRNAAKSSFFGVQYLFSNTSTLNITT